MDRRTQSLPPEWQKGKLNMTGEPKQGPMVTSKPTSRDLAPGSSVASTGDYTRDVIANRPGAIAQRSGQFPAIQNDVQVLLDDTGSFVSQQFTGGSFDGEHASPGDDGNTATGGQGGVEEAQGSATRTTGKPVMGSVVGKGAF